MRVHNFGAGPAALPLPVLERIQDELLDWHGKGLSILELGHRTPDFCDLIAQIETQLRDLLTIPDNYKVLFMPGGARVQFAMLACNLLRGHTKADYIDTGVWSQFAEKEARRYCQTHIVTSAADSEYTAIPARATWQCQADAAYLHYTDNETIQGVEFITPPSDIAVPLVSDMTSSILSKPLPIADFGMIYAAAQKNLGIAGITLVIVRDDLIGHALPTTPSVFDYAQAVETNSLYSTPPTFAWYVAGLICDWLQQQGGLAAVAATNAAKAAKLYDYIDASDFYHNSIDPACRSRMNVTFTLSDASLDADFLREAQQHDLAYLKGHRYVGGMRASLYNAISMQSVDALLSFMHDFVQRRG